MAEDPKAGDHISATISGDVSGQVGVGKGISQTNTVTSIEHQLTQKEKNDLLREFAALKEEVISQAPAQQRDAALERVEELEQAVASDQPDLPTMEYVRNWFVRNLPKLAGSITSLVVHPIVGKLVAAGGDALLGEFRRRFGD